jgi:hypothetical protein
MQQEHDTEGAVSFNQNHCIQSGTASTLPFPLPLVTAAVLDRCRRTQRGTPQPWAGTYPILGVGLTSV